MIVANPKRIAKKGSKKNLELDWPKKIPKTQKIKKKHKIKKMYSCRNGLKKNINKKAGPIVVVKVPKELGKNSHKGKYSNVLSVCDFR